MNIKKMNYEQMKYNKFTGYRLCRRPLDSDERTNRGFVDSLSSDDDDDDDDLLLFFQFSSLINYYFLFHLLLKAKYEHFWTNDETFEKIRETFLSNANNSKKYEIFEK